MNVKKLHMSLKKQKFITTYSFPKHLYLFLQNKKTHSTLPNIKKVRNRNASNLFYLGMLQKQSTNLS